VKPTVKQDILFLNTSPFWLHTLQKIIQNDDTEKRVVKKKVKNESTFDADSGIID